MVDSGPAFRQPLRFLWLYALAWSGGAVAYVPLLSILLPVRVSGLAGPGAAVPWLGYVAFFGAISASIGHIAFGYLSDVTRNRRGWIWTGLGLTCVLLLALNRVSSFSAMLSLIVCWQLALNMMLAPLAAWGGDTVPDSQKGMLGGLLAFAPGLGALSGAVVTIPELVSADIRLALVAAMVCACVVPVLLVGRPRPFAEVQKPLETAPRRARPPASKPFVRMWVSRLLIQIAEAALFAFLYFWFRTIDPAMNDYRTARVFTGVLILSAPIALIVGRWADRRGQPILPLIICSIVSAMGLSGMAMAHGLVMAIATYALFGFAASVFLALHSAQTLRVLPRPERRGRDLGLFNLTNTMPSLIMPLFTLSLVPAFGFSGLFLLFSGLSLCAGGLLATISRRP